MNNVMALFLVFYFLVLVASEEILVGEEIDENDVSTCQ